MFKPELAVIPVYFEYGATGTGMTDSDRLPLTDSTDIGFGLPIGFVPTHAEIIIESTCTGLTDVLFGIVGDSDALVKTGDVTAATASTYDGTGASLLVGRTAAAINFAVDFTGTISAGKLIAVVRGYRV